MDMQRILLLVDLKPHETLDDLDDVQMIRTIGAFYSSFPHANIGVIPITKLPQFAQSNQILINDIYLIGHGDFSTLGSGLTVEKCGQTFKEALLVPDFNIGHIHLTVCHSAETNFQGSIKSLLFSMHENLNKVPDKSILITGYRNQIHLVRTESLKCGQFKLNVDMPFAPIIHRGLQPLRIDNDCETLTGYVFKDLICFSNYCQTGNSPKETGPVFNMLHKFVTTLQDTGKDGPFYKTAESNYSDFKSKIENFDISLNEFSSGNNITIDKSTILIDEFKGLNLKQLREKFKELAAKKNEMNPDEFNKVFNQIYFSYQTFKSGLNLEEGEFFNNTRKILFNDLRAHFMAKLNCEEGDRNSTMIKYFCGETIHCLKEIYFDKSIMDLQKKIQFSQKLDQISVVYPTDTLDVHEFYLIDPEFQYTCQSGKKFPDIIFFSPTISWEKGFWKEVLDDMKYFKDDEVEYGLKYICDAFAEFKQKGNLEVMNEILTELPIKLFALLDSCKEKDDRLRHLQMIIALLEDNKEIIKLLDKKTLMNWEKLLEHDLPNKKYLGFYPEKLRKGALGFIQICLQPKDTPKDTSFILSSLAHASHTDIHSLSKEKESPRKEDTDVTREQTQLNIEPSSKPNPQPTTNQTQPNIPPSKPNPQPTTNQTPETSDLDTTNQQKNPNPFSS